jgi:hypothetical protein
MSARALIQVQYRGFDVGPLVREYRFAVRDTEERDTEPLSYTLTISNEAFVAHRVRYQDGAEICSQRLHRELGEHANHPPTTSFCISDAELTTYRDAHAPGAHRSHKRREEKAS